MFFSVSDVTSSTVSICLMSLMCFAPHFIEWPFRRSFHPILLSTKGSQLNPILRMYTLMKYYDLLLQQVTTFMYKQLLIFMAPLGESRKEMSRVLYPSRTPYPSRTAMLKTHPQGFCAGPYGPNWSNRWSSKLFHPSSSQEIGGRKNVILTVREGLRTLNNNYLLVCTAVNRIIMDLKPVYCLRVQPEGNKLSEGP